MKKTLFDWMPQFTGVQVSVDTRTLKKGDLFIALTGKNFDGHHFIQQAYEKGAAGALVNQGAVYSASTPLPLLTVADTHRALGQIAKIWRDNFNIPIIALTGSCGKTTTKAMVASILSHAGETLVTEGTLNNDIGVPLTLLKLTDKHQFAVIEIGTNHFGEIAYATQITQPTIAAVLNAGPSHLEFLENVASVAKEKSDIYQGADWGIINLDDQFASEWQKKVEYNQSHTLTFSMHNSSADVWATVIASQVGVQSNGLNPPFILHIGPHSVPIQLSILGR
ncbi:MAG: UDP-N-acetylmuramoyl-tripeptide--D-alanyl-D-alanine ligase, partial [Gammaproteobacteria bacterium]